MADGKKIHWTRTKTHEQTHLEAGKGIPESLSKRLKKHQRYLPKIAVSEEKAEEFLIRRSLTPKSVITNISALLDLDEYEFPEDEDTTIDPAKIDAKLDVTALDRYNDDIRRIRKLTIDECRLLPHKGEADETMLYKIRIIVRCLCRTAHYGTHKAQELAEGTSFAEMTWTAADLKRSLFRCSGMRVLAKLLVNGLNRGSEQARWACYTLVMACVGSADIIDSISKIPQFDEAVGEIAFHAYWKNWPANFGSILQGILSGPYSVVPTEDLCDFI